MPDYELVIVGESDLEAVLDLYRRCEDFLALGPQPFASREMVLADLAHSRENGGVFYGIFPGGRLAGVPDLTESGWLGAPHCACLSLLMIAREQRGLGLGARVLADVEARLRRQGVTRICGGVQVNNPQAVRFWQAHGFEISLQARLQEDGTTTCDIEKHL
ncbi:MAG TPA: GNAT family N-acetyltransferase [Anaerolinea sp.]|nr:GNAT family N-acetyltransferase [Anaerolinea sp.]